MESLQHGFIAHYGTPRHSGRYPYGSGENPRAARKEARERKKHEKWLAKRADNVVDAQKNREERLHDLDAIAGLSTIGLISAGTIIGGLVGGPIGLTGGTIAGAIAGSAASAGIKYEGKYKITQAFLDDLKHIDMNASKSEIAKGKSALDKVQNDISGIKISDITAMLNRKTK